MKIKKIKDSQVEFYSDISNKKLNSNNLYLIDNKLMGKDEVLKYCKVTSQQVLDSVINDDNNDVEEDAESQQLAKAEITTAAENGVAASEKIDVNKIIKSYTKKYKNFNELLIDYQQDKLQISKYLFVDILREIVKPIAFRTWRSCKNYDAKLDFNNDAEEFNSTLVNDILPYLKNLDAEKGAPLHYIRKSTKQKAIQWLAKELPYDLRKVNEAMYYVFGEKVDWAAWETLDSEQRKKFIEFEKHIRKGSFAYRDKNGNYKYLSREQYFDALTALGLSKKVSLDKVIGGGNTRGDKEITLSETIASEEKPDEEVVLEKLFDELQNIVSQNKSLYKGFKNSHGETFSDLEVQYVAVMVMIQNIDDTKEIIDKLYSLTKDEKWSPKSYNKEAKLSSISNHVCSLTRSIIEKMNDKALYDTYMKVFGKISQEETYIDTEEEDARKEKEEAEEAANLSAAEVKMAEIEKEMGRKLTQKDLFLMKKNGEITPEEFQSMYANLLK